MCEGRGVNVNRRRPSMEGMEVVKAVLGAILRAVIAVAVVAVIYKGAMRGYEFGYKVFADEPMTTGEGRSVTVTVTEGMSAKEMGELLYDRGLIDDKQLFNVQYMLSEYRKDLKAGTYELSTSMTVDEMLKTMAQKEDIA